jgi:hypothetical protein
MYMASIVHYTAIIALFLLDLVLHGWFACPVVYITRSLYYASLFKRLPLFEYFFIGALVLLQSFLYNGCCGIDLIIMVPLTIVAFQVRKVVDLNPLVHALLAVLGVLIHYAVIDYALMNRALSCMFNLKIIVIHFILVLILFYTILKGSSGNRSKL